MASTRLPRNLSRNETTRVLEALRTRGIEVADLTLSNPTQVGLDYPEDLLKPLASPAALTYDPHPLGRWSAREAVAADFARRGVAISPDDIALTASTSEAYAWLFKLLCDPGDAVLVPRPSYPLFEHLTMLEGVEAVPYRLEYHGAWRIDIDHLRHAIGPRTRAILVVSPNNPTGSFVHPDDLAALDGLCAEHDLVLIGDEVFADFAFAPGPCASVLHTNETVVCSLGGLSKTVGLPQVKLAWIGMGGPETRTAELMRAYEMIADTYLSVATPVQVALPALLSRGAGIREQIQRRLAANLDTLRRLVAATPEVTLLHPEAGWSAVLQVPAFRSEESLVLEALAEDHVLVHPGYFYDFEREAYVVVSLLGDPTVFAEAARRMLARAARPGRLA